MRQEEGVFRFSWRNASFRRMTRNSLVLRCFTGWDSSRTAVRNDSSFLRHHLPNCHPERSRRISRTAVRNDSSFLGHHLSKCHRERSRGISCNAVRNDSGFKRGTSQIGYPLIQRQRPSMPHATHEIVRLVYRRAQRGGLNWSMLPGCSNRSLGDHHVCMFAEQYQARAACCPKEFP